MKLVRVVPLLIWVVPLLIWWVVPLLIWAVPLLIWWVGGKMNLRIRLTSAKIRVGVEVEAELGNKKTHRMKSNFN